MTEKNCLLKRCISLINYRSLITFCQKMKKKFNISNDLCEFNMVLFNMVQYGIIKNFLFLDNRLWF